MHIYTHTRTNTHINILTGTNTQACLLKYAYARAQCTSKHAEINTNTKHNAYLQKQQQFKRVNRSMRCGRCHTCLNPKLKKACLTLRASQEKASGDGEDGLEHKVPCCGFRIDCAPCCASLSLSLSFSPCFQFYLQVILRTSNTAASQGWRWCTRQTCSPWQLRWHPWLPCCPHGLSERQQPALQGEQHPVEYGSVPGWLGRHLVWPAACVAKFR